MKGASEYMNKLNTLKHRAECLKRSLAIQKKVANKQIARSQSIQHLIMISKQSRAPEFNASVETQWKRETLLCKTLPQKLAKNRVDGNKCYQLIETHQDFLAKTLGQKQDIQLHHDLFRVYKQNFGGEIGHCSISLLERRNSMLKARLVRIDNHYRKLANNL